MSRISSNQDYVSNDEFSRFYDPDVIRIIKDQCSPHLVNCDRTTKAEDFRGSDYFLDCGYGPTGSHISKHHFWYDHTTYIRICNMNWNRSADLINLLNGNIRWYFYGWVDQNGRLDTYWMFLDAHRLSGIVNDLNSRIEYPRKGGSIYVNTFEQVASNGCIVECSKAVRDYLFSRIEA